MQDPFVLLNMGKWYTEFSEHKNAYDYFKRAFEIDKSRIEGCEYYSSCLWHLKKLKELANLA